MGFLIGLLTGAVVALLYALPLVVAWLWREHLGGALAFGAAAAIKQIAWFVAPFWLIAIAARDGWRAALRQGAAGARQQRIAIAAMRHARYRSFVSIPSATKGTRSTNESGG